MGFNTWLSNFKKTYIPKPWRDPTAYKESLKNIKGLGKAVGLLTIGYGSLKLLGAGLSEGKNFIKANTQAKVGKVNNKYYQESNPTKLLKSAEALYLNPLWYNRSAGYDIYPVDNIKQKEVTRMSILDEILAQAQLEKLAEELYGQPSQEELLQALLLEKIAEEYNQPSEEEILQALALQQLLGVEGGEEVGQEDELEKVAEAYYTGQIMAQGFIDALGSLEKDAENESTVNGSLEEILNQLVDNKKDETQADTSELLSKLLGL